MIRNIARFSGCLALLGLIALITGCRLGCHSELRDDPRQTTPLLLVSIDGFRYDYLDHFETPALDRLARDGLRADSLHQVFPTKTFATHYSLVTGLHPGTHGVVANNMWDPRRQSRFSLRDREAVSDGYWYQGGEPIWVTAERQRLITATYFWPGSEACIGRVRPTYWKPYDGRVAHAERIDQILDWLDLPPDQRPAFLTLYFSAVDSAGHRGGPLSEMTRAAVADVDGHLGDLLDALEADNRLDAINIIVVSDHGMSDVDTQRSILLNELIDLTGLNISDWGPAAQIWTGARDPQDLVAELREAHPHLRAWRRDEIPARYHFGSHRRVPDVLVEADPGWLITAAPFAANDRSPPLGMHGWDPALAEMHGVFIARGPDFIAGTRSPAVHSVDLYALMAELLDLQPAEHEGRLEAFSPYLGDGPAPAYRAERFDCRSEIVEARIGAQHMALHIGEFIHVLDRVGDGHFEAVDLAFEIDGETAGGRVDGRSLEGCRRLP
ncbi:MAG: alkaline phosphatase family protein [Pseudomonadota bacterium]|nr:MAG: alkaline phosphatase family protein [Pseudomonadota bacterium]